MNTIGPITNTSFRASRINIISMADNHGDVLKIPNIAKAIQMNKGDLFQKSTEKHTLNLLAIAGDYFMNPLKRGYLQNPEFTGGDIQYNFLQKLLYTVKMGAGKDAAFDAVFTPGNHDLDGGDQWLFNKLARSTMWTLTTNVDPSHSPLIKKLTEDKDVRIQASKIFEIPDSIDPNKMNHLLVLGLTIPSMKYYNPGLLKGTAFYDNSSKNDSLIEERDIKKTLRVIKFHVNQFKQKYPDGAIVVLSHMGNKISKMIAKSSPDINLILNGHDHKEFESMVGKTMILSHGQASSFFRGIQFIFEDDGDIFIQSKKYNTEKYEPIARKDRKMQEFVNTCVRQDLVPLVKYENPGALPEEMVLDDTIRYSNNVMANYITSGIKEAALKLYPDIDVVGIPSTIFRNGLKSNEKRTTMNNIDFLKIFDGVNDNLAPLQIGTITGKELYDLIYENVINNLKSRTRNALIQWSDIQINRSMIKDLKDNPDDTRSYSAIKIRDKKTGKFTDIDFNKEYKIIFSNKYLVKNTENIKQPAKIKSKFKTIDQTYDTLFKSYLESINYNIKYGRIAREDRII